MTKQRRLYFVSIQYPGDPREHVDSIYQYMKGFLGMGYNIGLNQRDISLILPGHHLHNAAEVLPEDAKMIVMLYDPEIMEDQSPVFESASNVETK